ncbi:MAG: hypothetical protein ABI647_01695 [Gemmatimonadota bacterium]
MDNDAAVRDTTVRVLAEVAGLPLSDERAMLLAPQLEVWVTLANELSRKMSASHHSTLVPITIFAHRSGGGAR